MPRPSGVKICAAQGELEGAKPRPLFFCHLSNNHGRVRMKKGKIVHNSG